MNGKVIKEVNEKFCYECGSAINAKAEICPKCGVRQIKLSKFTANTVFGVIAGAASFSLIASLCVEWGLELHFIVLVIYAILGIVFSMLSVIFNTGSLMLFVLLVSLAVFDFSNTAYEAYERTAWLSTNTVGLDIVIVSGCLMFFSSFCSFFLGLADMVKKQ